MEGEKTRSRFHAVSFSILDRAAWSWDNAVQAMFPGVIGFRGIDLAIVSPSDCTFRLSESVTWAQRSARTWSDGNLTTGEKSPRFESISASLCQVLLSGRANILPRSDTTDTNPCCPDQQSREHPIQRHTATLATRLVLTRQCDVVIEVLWSSRWVTPGGVLFDLSRKLHRNGYLLVHGKAR